MLVSICIRTYTPVDKLGKIFSIVKLDVSKNIMINSNILIVILV